MKDQPESIAFTTAKFADAVAQSDPVIPTLPGHRSLIDREHQGVALSQRRHHGPGLAARALFGEHELAAFELFARRGQQHRHLQWKPVLA